MYIASLVMISRFLDLCQNFYILSWRVSANLKKNIYQVSVNHFWTGVLAKPKMCKWNILYDDQNQLHTTCFGFLNWKLIPMFESV